MVFLTNVSSFFLNLKKNELDISRLTFDGHILLTWDSGVFIEAKKKTIFLGTMDGQLVNCKSSLHWK